MVPTVKYSATYGTYCEIQWYLWYLLLNTLTVKYSDTYCLVPTAVKYSDTHAVVLTVKYSDIYSMVLTVKYSDTYCKYKKRQKSKPLKNLIMLRGAVKKQHAT